MNIYIGNIPLHTTEEDIKQLFHPYGTIHTMQIIMDEQSGQSKGFGFIEMADEEEGVRAVSELNGINLLGNFLEIKHVRERPASGI
jgi:RNA recognition motif-containing protein